jgi:hypothetical protein
MADALLTPEESVLILIDHQAFQFANMHSHEPQLVVGNVVALARTAKVFGVPTILTTVYILQAIQDEFPDQKPINRTWTNAWQDQRLVDAVRKIGRRKLVMGACGQGSALRRPRCGRRAKITMSMRLRMHPAVFLSSCTPWRYSGWFRPASSRSLGSRCCANGSDIGLARKQSRILQRF